MPAPQPADIRALLEGFGLDASRTLALTGTLTSGSAVVAGVDASAVKVGDQLFGAGVPAEARVLSVDVPLASPNGQFTMDAPAAADGPQSLQALQYTVLSDGWLMRRRDSYVVPWVERVTRLSFNGVQQATEYYDGTGGPLLVLRRRPIVELLAISYTNVDSNLYYLTPSAMQVIAEEGVLKAKANFNESTYIPIFYRGDRNIRVTYRYGFADYPADAFEAVTKLLAVEALTLVSSRTGGGSLNTQGYSRTFGKSGKYTEVKRDLARSAISLLRKYMTGGGS